MRFGGIIALDGVSFEVYRVRSSARSAPTGRQGHAVQRGNRLYDFERGSIVFNGQSLQGLPVTV